jgi:hypothetical protein
VDYYENEQSEKIFSALSTTWLSSKVGSSALDWATGSFSLNVNKEIEIQA